MRSPPLPLPLLALALLLPGCLDLGTDPAEARVATIRLSESTLTLDDGAAVQLNAETLDRSGRVLPGGAVRVVWSSSDEAVATVGDGLVTGRRPGEVRITATVRQVSASAEVKVRAVPQALATVSGAAQQGVAGMPAPHDLVVLVTDRHGDGVPGVGVEFAVVKGEGSVAPASAQTDARGIARAAWTLGKVMGENAVEGRVAGRSLAPAVFAAMGRAGPPARLEKLGGDGQQAPAATQLMLPLVARVLDANDNPVAGASVAWRPTHGGSVAPDVSVSDGAGEARATWLLGPGAGEQAVEAWVEGTPARTQFAARAGVGAAARLEKVSGDGQEATVTQPLAEPLVVRVVDAPGNPVPGVKIAWTLGYGGGTVAPAESLTDAQGYARATWTLGTIMATHRLEARASELSMAPVAFTALARVGAPAHFEKRGGDDQESEVGYTLPVPLVVRVTDAHGNPVSGVPVQWEGTGMMRPVETETDAQGLARGTWVLGTKAGPQTMKATALDRTVSFSASAYLGPAVLVTVVPDAFNLLVGDTWQLRATATDLFGNVGDGRGRALTWSSSDLGIATVSASGLVTAAAAGEATITATRDGVSGSARVRVTTDVSITDLGAGVARAINARGQIVGQGLLGATLWQNGTAISVTPGVFGNAYAINAGGQVVGHKAFLDFGGTAVFLWEDGTLLEIWRGTILPRISTGYGINSVGEVVGYTQSGTGGRLFAFFWKDGVAYRLPNFGNLLASAFGINDASQIVGFSVTPAGYRHAVLWTHDGATEPPTPGGALTDLGTLGGQVSEAHAINSAGRIAGFSETVAGETHAFLWKDGVMTDLGTLGGRNSHAYGINDAGHVVGSSETANGETHAFLWKDGVMIDLGTLNGGKSVAYGINGSGWIVGYSQTTGGESRAVLWKTR